MGARQKLVASDIAANDRFGIGLAVEGDTVVVGSDRHDDDGEDSGSAYVFQFDGSSWSETHKLVASDAHKGDEFGFSVAHHNQTIIVGAPVRDGFSGAAYVFKLDDGRWTETQLLLAADAPNSSALGSAAAVSGTNLVLGAPQDSSNGDTAGAAYVFDLEARLGDLNCDGSVGVSDLLILLASWGPCLDCSDCPADLDGNCTVSVSDLLILLANWG